MEIYAKEMIQILHRNFDYPIIKSVFGDVIGFSSYEAFIYSTITGAGYLVNPTYPFSPRPLLKILNKVLSYETITGIFDGSKLKYTPINLSSKYPFLFDNTAKFLLPVEFATEKEFFIKLGKIQKIAEENSIKAESILVQRIETFKKGNGMEPFLEFVVAEFFKRNGYLVESQIPLSHNLGSPDFAAYLLKNGIIINNSGFHFIELALLRLYPNLIVSSKNNNRDFVVGEAKTSTKLMSTQIKKYIDSGFFNKAYEIHPSKKKPYYPFSGLISFNENYTIKVREPENDFPYVNFNLLDKYESWLNNYMKLYILANLTTKELYSFLNISREKDFNIYKIVDLIEIYTIEQLIATLEGEYYGTIK